MKTLALLLLLIPSLAWAGDCPWTKRRAIDDKGDALRKCGTPGFTNVIDSYQSGPNIVTKEVWIYNNSDGSQTVITFRGDKKVDFDQR